MTLDEEQEFQILKILIDKNVDKFSFQSLPPEIKNIIGGGEWEIIRQMASKGLFADLHQAFPEYQVTNATKTRYFALKNKKCKDLVKTIAFWLTLAAALISAGYAVATYYATDDTKSPQSATPVLLQMQPQSDTSHKSQQLVRPDTTIPKIISSYIDTAKTKTKTK